MIYPVALALFLLSLFTQLAYTFISYWALIVHKVALGTPTSEGVSLVVCTHNRLIQVKNLLHKLLEQSYPEMEIVVVNDRSNDGSGSFLQELGDQGLITYVEITKTKPGYNAKKYALTKGITASRHDLIILTDDDCYPVSDRWVEQMAGKFSLGNNFVLGYSQYEPRASWLNHFIRYETLLTGMNYLSFAVVGFPYMGVGRNLGIRKSFYLEKGGYSGFEGVTGGDDDLLVNRYADKFNTAVAVGSELLVMSGPKEDIKSFFRQKTRHLSVGKMYKLSDKLRIGGQSLTHLLFWCTFIILAAAGEQPMVILVGFLLRMLVNGVVYSKVASKLGDSISIWYLPLVDFLYPVYYVIVGAAALFSKAIKWN